MPRRTLLTALIVTLLLGAAALAPQVPAVRDGLLRYALRAAESAGVHVSYQRSSGNAWRGMTLHDVVVDGLGSHVEVDRLSAVYFLPALLGGELPLDVEVEGARGELDLSGLQAMAGGGSGGGGGGLAPRVRLGEVRLSGVEVHAKQVPFTLPDVSLSDVHLQSTESGLLLGGELTTSEGSARFHGTLDPETLDFDGVIEHADATLARHWWDGVSAGSVTGRVGVVRGALQGDFALEGVSVAGIGLRADDVSGTATLRYPVVTADVQGRGMGGLVAATGRVDIEAQRFSASGDATPSLASAAGWLLREAFPDGLPVDVEGSTRLRLEVSGWETVSAQGSATGAGVISGLVLDDLAARFALTAGGGLVVESDATLAGAPLDLTVSTTPRGQQLLQVRAGAMDLSTLDYRGFRPGGTLLATQLDLGLGGAADARLRSGWQGSVAGTEADLTLDARLDADGWQAFVAGATSSGVDVAGAAVLANGRVDGGVNLKGVRVEQLTAPVDLALSAAGPLGSLALTLTLGGEQPVGLDLSSLGLAADIDLRGNASARLASGALGPVTGRFGPVELRGEVSTEPLGAAVDWSLAPVAVSGGGVGGTVSVGNGRLELASSGGAVRVTGSGSIVGAHAGPVEVDVGDVSFAVSVADGWSLEVTAPDDRLHLDAGSAAPLAAAFAGLPTRLDGDEAWTSLSGAVSARPDGGYDVRARLPGGANVAGIELPSAVAVTGVVAADTGSATGTASVGGLRVDVSADWAEARELRAEAAGVALTYSLADSTWAARGHADVGELLTALGPAVPGVRGTLALDVEGDASAGTLLGPMTLALESPVSLSLSGVGSGRRIELQATGDVGGLALAGTGSVDVASLGGASLLVDAGPLRGIAVDLQGARGSGTLTDLSVGPLAVPPTPWELAFSWSELAGSLSLGGESLGVRRTGDAWRVSGSLGLGLEYGGTEYRLTAAPSRAGDGAGEAADGAEVTDLASLPLSAVLVNVASGATIATARGTPSDLAVELDAQAAELAAALPEAWRPDWRLTGTADVDLLRGPAYRASIDVTPAPGAEPLRARVSGTGARANLVLEGAGVFASSEIVAGAGQVRLRADGASLDRYLPAGFGGTLSGTLALEGGRWLGALTARLDGPVEATVTLSGHGEELRVSATARVATARVATASVATASAATAGAVTANAATASATEAATVSAGGTLLPRLVLEGTADALDGLATATFAWNDGLTGELTTTPIDLGGLARVPALAFDFGYDTRTGEASLLQRSDVAGGSTGRVVLADGVLSGDVVVPVESEAGPIRVVAELGGSLADARLTATVTGAVEGSATGSLAEGVSGRLSVAAAAAAAVPGLEAAAGVLAGPIGVGFQLAPGGTWTATATADVAAGEGGPSATVQAQLAGAGLDYSGTLALAQDGGALASAQLSGAGDDMHAVLDLATVDWRRLGAAFGADLNVTGGGLVTFETRPLAAGLTIDLTAHAGGNDLRLWGSAPNDLRVSLTGPAGELAGLLAWTTAADALPQARLDGSFGGTPLSLAVSVDRVGGGALEARYGEASLTARVGAPLGEGGAVPSVPAGVGEPGAPGAGSPVAHTGDRTIAVEVSAPVGGVLGFGLEATSALTLSGSDVTVDALDATAHGLLADDAVRLSLAGSLLGTAGLDLTGTLGASGLAEPASVRLAGDTLRLTWHDVVATAEAEGLALDALRVHLGGSATADEVTGLLALFRGLPADLLDARVSLSGADIGWSGAGGFEGSLAATAVHPALPDVRADLRATGDGELRVGLEVWHGGGAPLLDASATLGGAAPAQATLTGAGKLSVPIEELLPEASAAPTTLAADLELGGTVASPSVSGTARLTGAVAAEGPVSYADGALRAALDGDSLRASLTAGAGTLWHADVAVDDYDLSAYLPQLTAPRLSLTARVGGDGATVDDLRISAPRSEVTGSGSLGAHGVSLNLDASVNLADVVIGDTRLSGMLRGPVALAAPGASAPLSAATVTASLDATAVSVPGLDGSVSGRASLGGTLADPLLNADLRGDGRIGGALSVSARPASGELELTSDLASGPFATDLRASLRGRRASASGTARWGEAVLLFSNAQNDDGAAVAVTGAGKLSGWTALIGSDLGTASVTGDLATVSSSLGGALTLELAAGSSGPWLSADVVDASVAGVGLGHLSLASAAPLAPITLESPHVTAELALDAGRWTATVTELPVSDGITVSADAGGSLSELTARARVAGNDLEVALDLTATSQGVAADVTGHAFGGALDVSASRPQGATTWAGTATYQGAQLAGFAVTATGTVQGEGDLPQLVLRTRAEGPVNAEGHVTVSIAGLTVDQVVTGGPLSAPVRVQGRLLPGGDVTVSTLSETPAPGATGALPTTSQVRLRSVMGAGLMAQGAAGLDVGPLRVTLQGDGSAPTLGVQAGALPGLRLEGPLRAPDLVSLVTSMVEGGLELTGSDAMRGSATLVLAPAPRVELHGLGLTLAGIDVVASGTLSAAAADVQGEVVVVTDLPLATGPGAAAGPTEYRLPWRLTAADGSWHVEYEGDLGELSGDYSPEGAVTLDASLLLSGGRVVARLGHEGGDLRGNLQVEGVGLQVPGLGGVSVAVDSSIADGRVGGSAVLESDAGRLTLTGSWGLGGFLPDAVVQGAPTGGRLEARLRTLELSKVPAVLSRAPYLSGTLTGVVQLRDGLVFGQLVSPEIAAGGTVSPLELSLSGSLSSLDLSLRLKGGTLSANLAGDRLSGVGRFERFPAQFLAQAVVGPSDVAADTTGVLRFDMPLGDLSSGFLRLATEEVRLERAGVQTLGNVTLTFDDQALVVERAEFAGLGRWEAQGELTQERLDFHLSAMEADFTPLLGLVPGLARLGVGAAGTFTVEVTGDATLPKARLASPGLDVEVAGSRYRLEDTEVTLDGADLSVAAHVSGVSPLSGSLAVTGGGRLSLAPVALSGVQVEFGGSLDLPGFGVVEGLSGAITKDDAGDLRVDASGAMGDGRLALAGTLLPLELSVSGEGLDVAFPALLVADARVAADLRLRSEAGGVALGGSIVADEVVVDPGARQPAAESAPAEAGAEAGQGAAPQPGPNPLAALRFDDLVIRAPQRVLLTTNLGTGEAALDLVLSGTAADPRLSGNAQALRGNLRFSGRDFTIDRAVATFSPSRGVFPELDVAAHAEFDKARVVASDERVSFSAPREGQSFVVNLAFTGQMLPAPAEEGGFRFDVQPRVSSDARIEVEGEGVRAFTEAELMSLIALGRFELNAGIIASGGLGQAVAQGALDTAVDLLVVSELSNALRQALGLDVVEIRTSALSSLIDDSSHPFGVSLRLGGYLNPELFASYRIGTYEGDDRAYAVTNEVLLSYALGPLDLDVSARVDLPTAGSNDSARPEVGVALSYDFGPTFGVDAGVVLSTQRSAFQVGLTLRW